MKDELLGSACFSGADLEAEHNGALFKKTVFEAPLRTGKGELVEQNNTNTSINFVLELVPSIEWSGCT